MNDFDWVCEDYTLFSTTNVENYVNADKLFVSFLKELENRKTNLGNRFSIKEVSSIIPKGTAGIDNPATYGYSFMSMLSGQKDRDYFIFENKNLKDEFTQNCRNPNRDNYFWKKHHSDEDLRINPKYLY